MRKYSATGTKSSVGDQQKQQQQQQSQQPQYSLLSFNAGQAYASLTRGVHQSHYHHQQQQQQQPTLLLHQDVGSTPASYIYIQQPPDDGSGLGQT